MYYQQFRVAGVINIITADQGLMSEVAAPRTIKAVLINVSAYEANSVEGWIGNTRVMQIPDELLDTEEDLGAANFPYSTNKMQRIPLDLPIPAGQIFHVSIACGGVASNIRGAYEWELTAP